MSYSNLHWVVKVQVIYGSDNRHTFQIPPWRNIENEIDESGNVNLFSEELMKHIPSTDSGEDCEVYSAQLMETIRHKYEMSLVEEFECKNYDEYRKQTKTPPKMTNPFFFEQYRDGSINDQIEHSLQPLRKPRTKGRKLLKITP